MIYAIQILQKQIDLLLAERDKQEKISDEPEMIIDYEFAMNTIHNIDIKIGELTYAIKTLNNNPHTTITICPECQEVICECPKPVKNV